MALSTGDINLYHPQEWPGIDDITSQIGGDVNTGAPVPISSTGIFQTGTSNVAGGSTFIRYSKIFIRNDSTGNLFKNPLVYITNQTFNNQITIAPDPFYFTGDHATWGGQGHLRATGRSENRATLPDYLSSSDFSGYTAASPLDFQAIATTGITLNSGDTVSVWVRMTIQAGLPASENNTFSLGIRGESV